MDPSIRVIIRKNQATQTECLATLFVEPGSAHDKLIGNREQLIDLVRNPRKIYTNILLRIGRPPMRDTGSYICLMTRTLEDVPIKQHLDFSPTTRELHRAGLDYNGNYYTDV
jgi:hypothetical protein